MAKSLQDRFETTDGSRPEASEVSEERARTLPLSAFGILRGGDVMEGTGRPPKDGEARATAWADAKLEVDGSDFPQDAARVRADAIRQLSGNPQLIARMETVKPIRVDLIRPGRTIAGAGYPKAISRNAAGLFWNRDEWDRARIALRCDRLAVDEALVIHEFGHAIHYLALTKAERELIYTLLRPTFGSRQAMDEVFAIYSEREFVDAFAVDKQKAPGVYGYTRREWHENHVFTRFVRKLYFPYRRAAGPDMAPLSGGGWMNGLARR